MKPTFIALGLAAVILTIAGCSSPEPAKPSKPAKPVAVAAAAPAPQQPAPAEAQAAPAAPVVVAPEVTEVVAQLTEPEDGSKQHQVVEATGFPQAMASLQPGAVAPGVDKPVNYGSQPPTRGLTGDGATAELVERDWVGLVLVPVNADFAKAFTSLVRLTSIEAHPLTDGRVRTWMRVRNVVDYPVQVGVACRFQLKDQSEATPARYYSLSIPVGEYRDVFFVSPKGSLTSYTVLVKKGS